VHSVDPAAGADEPAGHGLHVALPGLVAYDDGQQYWHLPLPDEKEPAGHGRHSVEPGTMVVWPGRHIVQLAFPTSNSSPLEPSGHGIHPRAGENVVPFGQK
jgi:hypothetical protein